MSETEPPKCWCGVVMSFKGNGAFPYDCPAKDFYPNAPIWFSEECGHSCWTWVEPDGRKGKGSFTPNRSCTNQQQSGIL